MYFFYQGCAPSLPPSLTQGHERNNGPLLAGADAGFKDSTGKTALMYAAICGFSECVDLLRRLHPASLNQTCAKGNTALHYAVLGKDQKSVRALTVPGLTEFGVRNRDGQTAEQLAGDSVIGLSIQTAEKYARSVSDFERFCVRREDERDKEREGARARR